MFKKTNRYIFLIVALCFFILAALFENSLLRQHPEVHLIRDFQIKLNENEQLLEYRMQQIKTGITETGFDPNFARLFQENHLLGDNNGMGFLVYDTTELRYWSDRAISFYDHEDTEQLHEGMVQLPNGFYLVKKKEAGPFSIYGFHLIKHSYRYENKYLDKDFFKAYNLPQQFKIIGKQRPPAVPVNSYSGKYLFSILPSGSYLCTTSQLYIPGIIYLIGLILLLYFFRRSFIESNSPFFFKLAGLAAALFLVYWMHILFKVPALFFHLDFFSPKYFAHSISTST